MQEIECLISIGTADVDMLPEDNKRQKSLQLQENYEIFELMQQQGLHKQYMRNMLHLNNGDGTFSENWAIGRYFKNGLELDANICRL